VPLFFCPSFMHRVKGDDAMRYWLMKREDQAKHRRNPHGYSFSTF
jgi:hypothetical protein